MHEDGNNEIYGMRLLYNNNKAVKLSFFDSFAMPFISSVHCILVAGLILEFNLFPHFLLVPLFMFFASFHTIVKVINNPLGREEERDWKKKPWKCEQAIERTSEWVAHESD